MAAPSSSSSNEEIITTLIGLCDGELDTRHHHHHSSSFSTNKIGDLPDPLPAVRWQHPRCSVCEAALVHVVQIYCPLHASPYHRCIHVFACCGPSCTGRQEDTWRAVRSQCLETDVKATKTPLVEEASPAAVNGLPVSSSTDWCEDADDWGMEDEDPPTHNAAPIHTAVDPGIRAPTAVECEVSEQLEDLTLRVSDSQTEQQCVPVLRPFYVSVMEEDDLHAQQEDVLEHHVRKLLKEYERREGVSVGELDGCDAGGDGEKYEKTKARHGDAVFSRFMKKISICPEQILRYCWNGKPLFISEPPSNITQMVPPCSSCGSPRTFEFQLMPALVSLLRAKDSTTNCDPAAVLEFGTVLVYTCRNSCWPSGSSNTPREEFLFVQADPDQKFFK